MSARTGAEAITHALTADFTTEDDWIEASEAALEALAVIEDQSARHEERVAVLEGRLADAENERDARRERKLLVEKLGAKLNEVEGRLAEATEALRDIAEGGPNGAGRTVSAPERAREALRAEPAKDDPNEGLAEEFTQAQEWGFDHPPLRGQA